MRIATFFSRHKSVASLKFISFTLFFVICSLILTGKSYSNSHKVINVEKWAQQWSLCQKSFSDLNEDKNFQPYISPVIGYNQPAQKISVNITGLDTLALVVTIGEDDYHQDHAVWGEATLYKENGSHVRLSDLTPIYSSTGWSTMVKNENYYGKQLQIASQKLNHGVIAHSHSEIVYVLNGTFNRFEAFIGIDRDGGQRGDVRFKVLSHSEKNKLAPLENVAFTDPVEIPGLTELEQYMWLYNNNTKEAQNNLILSRIENLGRNGTVLKEQFKQLSQQQIDIYDIRWFDLYKKSCQLKQALAELNTIHMESLEKAVQDLCTSYPREYSNGQEYLQRINTLKTQKKAIEQALTQFDPDAQNEVVKFIKEYTRLKHNALTDNPLVKKHPILFVVRNQYKPDHHNTATIFQTGEVNTSSFQGGGALKMIDFANNGKITTLLEDSNCVFRDPEVHYDGNKIVFSMRKDITDNYHIYEINSDGSGFKQLTSAPGVADIDPNYLPDDDIVFSSTREPKYCMCNIHIMANLFRMDADGANIYQIGKSTLFEGHSAMMPDGRILYDRWEYVDRNFGDAQGLWTVNPDGTNHAVYWGNNTNSPGGVIDARYLPGSNGVIAILGSCHDRPWGALGIIDRRLGLDLKEPIVRTWPADAIDLVGKGDYDTFKQVRPRYEDPYPLDSKYFLCSRTIKEEQMGIFLIDVFGNEVLLHTEGPGCFDPMPVGPRPRPQIIPFKRNFTSQTGTFFVQDVYIGTHMQGVERGTVKTLRVIESPEKRFWTEPAWGGQGVHRPGLNWHSFENKRILGDVPVERDGSAYFEVPANTFVYFQLLDENGMMVQSMRSGTMLQSGETLGCIGCHDQRQTAPSQKQKYPLAAQRTPNSLNGWYGEPRIFSYMQEVQPVFDKNCVQCHDFGKKAGQKLVLAGDRNLFFNASYIELWQNKYINSIGAGPSDIQPAYSWGSHSSKLVEALKKGHHGVTLNKEEWDRINTWIDINGVYYSEYSSAYPTNLAGRSPLNKNQINRLKELTGVDFFSLAKHDRTLGPQISFERPALSPCLENIPDKNSAEYKEALAIISDGNKTLQAKPRADMEFYQANKVDQQRQIKYLTRQQIDAENKKANMTGKKLYDSSHLHDE